VHLQGIQESGNEATAGKSNVTFNKIFCKVLNVYIYLVMQDGKNGQLAPGYWISGHVQLALQYPARSVH
jgi:hypothetical protein